MFELVKKTERGERGESRGGGGGGREITERLRKRRFGSRRNCKRVILVSSVKNREVSRCALYRLVEIIIISQHRLIQDQPEKSGLQNKGCD